VAGGSHGGAWRQRHRLRRAEATVRVQSKTAGQCRAARHAAARTWAPQSEYRIGDVRGVGLMIATEFTAPDGAPDGATAKAAVKAAQQNGLLLLTCGTYDNIVRWIPPLIVDEAQVAEAVQIFAAALPRRSAEC
jgi:4-aminobutyrate aminotransferase-like enzyme